MRRFFFSILITVGILFVLFTQISLRDLYTLFTSREESIGGIGNWGTLEVGWTAGFLMTGLQKEQAIATGFGVHILVFVICVLFGLVSWLTLKRRKPSS